MDGLLDLIMSLVNTSTLALGIVKIIQYLPKTALGMCSQLFIFWCVADDVYQNDSNKRSLAKRLSVLGVLVVVLAMVLFGIIY